MKILVVGPLMFFSHYLAFETGGDGSGGGGTSVPPAPSVPADAPIAEAGSSPQGTMPTASRTAADLTSEEHKRVDDALAAGLLQAGINEQTIARDLIIDGDVAYKAMEAARVTLNLPPFLGKPGSVDDNVAVGVVSDALKDWYVANTAAPAPQA